MAMSDELASASLGATQKSMEAALELIRMLSPLAKKLISGILEKSEQIGKNGVSDVKGAVSQAKLIVESNKANSPIITNENFLSNDIEGITEKAKANGIPIHIIGDGEKQSISFLERDKAVVNQIVQDVVSERLKEAPQSVKCFSVNEHNVAAIEAQFDENNIECQFIQGKDGKVYCTYPAEDAAKVDVLKQDFKDAREEIGEKLNATRSEDGAIQFEDTALGKTFIINDDDVMLNKKSVMDICKEQFGYSNAEAELAANKICDDLKLNPEQYFKSADQIDNIEMMKTNIKYQSDSILVRDTQFNAVSFKAGNNTHIFVANGENQAVLTPSKMTEQEMKNICTTQMNMTEEQASETVSKSMKINTQINSKLKETTIDKSTGLTTAIDINRTANNAFSVKVGTRQKTYNLNTIDTADKISKDFGIPLDKAKNIVNKANSQSTMLNKVTEAMKKVGKAKKEASKVVEKVGKKR